MGWSTNDFETYCRTCGKRILMVKRPAWHAVEIKTGNRHVCSRDYFMKEDVEVKSRLEYLTEKEFLTKKEQAEYEGLVMKMKNK